MGPPKTLQTMYLNMFLNIFGSPPEHPLCAHQEMAQRKWTLTSAQGDRTKHSFFFVVAIFVLRASLGDRPRRALHFQNMQYRIGFIDVFDALIESMLDHQVATPKWKNEPHAA